MPIECSVEIRSVEQDGFHDIDHVVMGHAFDLHNTLGRFCDEAIYQNDLAQRCRASGFNVHREVQIRVTYKDFLKPYYLDMLVDGGVIYELKTVNRLNRGHLQQLINYLLLTGLSHGKLVNFRPGSVEYRFASTTLRKKDRMDFRLLEVGWEGEDEEGGQIREILCALLAEWGAFLDVNLYREALIHFLSGSGAGVQPVEIGTNDRIAGSQKMCLLNSTTAWHISAVRKELGSYENHIKRLLNHTALQKLHWINLNQKYITLKTVSHDSVEK